MRISDWSSDVCSSDLAWNDDACGGRPPETDRYNYKNLYWYIYKYSWPIQLYIYRDSTMDATTLTAHVMREIHQRIAGRCLITGAKLPPIRALAGNMKVSKSKFVEAYERLAAEGTCFERRGWGLYVSAPSSRAPC